MESEKESVKDLIVDVSPTEVQLALMENHRLIELNKESTTGHSFTVGDVFLGKVKKIMPALNAAFVDIGDEKEAFMETVKESLANEENVYLRGFGSFILKKRAQKTARNISKNTTIIIPEHNIPAFKPAKTFTLSIKE